MPRLPRKWFHFHSVQSLVTVTVLTDSNPILMTAYDERIWSPTLFRLKEYPQTNSNWMHMKYFLNATSVNKALNFTFLLNQFSDLIFKWYHSICNCPLVFLDFLSRSSLVQVFRCLSGQTGSIFLCLSSCRLRRTCLRHKVFTNDTMQAGNIINIFKELILL